MKRRDLGNDKGKIVKLGEYFNDRFGRVFVLCVFQHTLFQRILNKELL